MHFAFWLLLLAFSLPVPSSSGYFYVGQFPANVWHNSTTIFVMPLVVLLFWQSYRSLLEPTWRNMWLVLLLAGANLAAKPSFVICVGIVFPLFALVRYRLSPPFWRVVSVMAMTFVLLIIQVWYTFKASATDVLYEGLEKGAGLKIDLFNSSSRRIASWLALALLFAASTPHFHVDHVDHSDSIGPFSPSDPDSPIGAHIQIHPAIADAGGMHASDAARTDDTDATTDATDATNAVSSDDQHDEHQSSASTESAPCQICRSSKRNPLDRAPPSARLLERSAHTIMGAPAPTGFTACFASVHPARAPPRLA